MCMSVTQSCLCNPKDCSSPGSSVHGILQARIQNGLPFPSSRDLPNPGIKPRSPAWQTDSLLSEPPGKPQGKVDLDIKATVKVVQRWGWELREMVCHFCHSFLETLPWPPLSLAVWTLLLLPFWGPVSVNVLIQHYLGECVQEPPDGYQAPAQHFSNLTQRWHSSSQLQGPKTSLLSKVRPPWGGSWVVCQVIIPGDFSAHWRISEFIWEK